MTRASNMPPKTYSEFWDGALFTLTDVPMTPLDPFAPIAADIASMVVQLDGDDAAKLDAVAGVKALLHASKLSLADLADRVEGKGAVPRRLMN